MQTLPQYYLNGNQISDYKYAFDMLQRAIWYGESAFETCLCQSGKISLAKQHKNRLVHAAALWNIELPSDFWEHSVESIITNESLSIARILLSRRPGGKYKPGVLEGQILVEITPVEQLSTSFILDIDTIVVKQPHTLNEIKSHCYPYIQAAMQTEGIPLLMNTQGEIIECGIGCIFYRIDGNWHYPPKYSGQVESVLLNALLEGDFIWPLDGSPTARTLLVSEKVRVEEWAIGNAVVGTNICKT